MIRKVRVENFKSIPDLTLDLGRVNVLIGANGSGKSNVLEAIALASAAAQNKLDNEFLISRGIRTTEKRLSCEPHSRRNPQPLKGIAISVNVEGERVYNCDLLSDETVSYPKWQQRFPLDLLEPVYENLLAKHPRLSRDLLAGEEIRSSMESAVAEAVASRLRKSSSPILSFLIYAPENSALRTFQSEGQILPLGIKGEGLFAHLKGLNSIGNKDRLLKIMEKLTLIDWFETFVVPEDLSPGERSIRIRDRFLAEGNLFDQRSANEGFLFLLFYLTLLISPETPAFFAIDNIDTSLNPKLCIALLQQIAELAKEYDKQVILTTHNPAILDGLNLQDDEQRLLVVDRNKEGHTRVRRIEPPKPAAGKEPVSLSEAFMRGYIGGLPKNF